MSIRISTDFDLRQRKPLDSRAVYDDIASMKLASDSYKVYGLYNGLVCWIKAENKEYIFNESNESDTDIGRWRPYTNMVPIIPEDEIKEAVV